jgi:hypothetical protein
LRATNRTLEKALAAANSDAARLQADLNQVQARLVEAHQHNRGLAERWRAGRKQAGFMGAAIATAVVIVSGVLVDRLFIHPSAPAVTAEPTRPFSLTARSSGEPARPQPPDRPFASASAVPPLSGAPNAPPASAENDPELQSALKRLSHTGQEQDQGDGPESPASAGPAAGVVLPANAGGYLSPEAYGGIITHVRTCWRNHVSRLGDVRFQARLHVLTDEGGVVREARLAEEDMAHLSDPSFQTYVQAAMHAVLDRDCAQLPIPTEKLGRKITFDFVFIP